MADKEDKTPLNVVGRFYNDMTCIDCDLCRGMAPELFTRDDDEGVSYVWKQPRSEEEMRLAIEAMEACPSESIGCDG